MNVMEKNPENGLLTTGALARSAGVTLRTVRWYTEQGIICPVENKNSRALYDAKDSQRLKKVCVLRECGFALSDIREIIDTVTTCPTVRKKKTLKLRNSAITIRDRLADRLDVFRRTLDNLDRVLEQTGRCPTCPSRGKNSDCAGCENLAALETACAG